MSFQAKLDSGEVPHGFGLGHSSFCVPGNGKVGAALVLFEPRVPGDRKKGIWGNEANTARYSLTRRGLDN